MATGQHTIETVQERGLAKGGRAFSGGIATVVARLRATNEASVSIDFVRLRSGEWMVNGDRKGPLTMPEGYVNPVFEARGVAGNVPVI